MGLDHVSSCSWDIWGFFQNNFSSNYKIGACSRKLGKISIKKKIKIAHNPSLAWGGNVSMWSFSLILPTFIEHLLCARSPGDAAVGMTEPALPPSAGSQARGRNGYQRETNIINNYAGQLEANKKIKFTVKL